MLSFHEFPKSGGDSEQEGFSDKGFPKLLLGLVSQPRSLFWGPLVGLLVQNGSVCAG